MQSFFFFNDTATTEIYTLSLHDALPILQLRIRTVPLGQHPRALQLDRRAGKRVRQQDRKSTRLNSSHSQISYAVFCLKKKKTIRNIRSSLRVQQACASLVSPPGDSYTYA